MVVIQQVAAEIGRVTGARIARNLRRHYPRPVLWAMVSLLLIANVVNLGADLSAMGAALVLLTGGNAVLYTLLFGILCVVLEVTLSYPRYAAILKWSTLSLFAYVAVVAGVPWWRALTALIVPELQWNADYATAMVAISAPRSAPTSFSGRQARRSRSSTDIMPSHCVSHRAMPDRNSSGSGSTR